MREWVVLAETDPLDGLTHSMVEYVIVLRYYALSPRTRVGRVELAARLGWRFGWETRYPLRVPKRWVGVGLGVGSYVI
jgi:hypothetical protein